MPVNLDSGSFKIVSLAEPNAPLGVNLTKPAWQNVYTNAPLKLWRVRKVGPNKYHLSVSPYGFTGVINGNVVGTIYSEQNVEWEITYHKIHEAYTITRADDRAIGWTIEPSFGEGEHANVEIRPIRSTRSLPPQFFPTQLFKLEHSDE